MKFLIVICSVVLSTSSYAQYKGGNGDGFASISKSITVSIDTQKPPKIRIDNRVISLIGAQGDNELQVFSISGKLIATSKANKMTVPGDDFVVLYQIITKENNVFTGKLWLK